MNDVDVIKFSVCLNASNFDANSASLAVNNGGIMQKDSIVNYLKHGFIKLKFHKYLSTLLRAGWVNNKRNTLKWISLSSYEIINGLWILRALFYVKFCKRKIFHLNC